MITFQHSGENWIEKIQVVQREDLSLENLLDYYTPKQEKTFGRLFSEYLRDAFTEVSDPGAILGAIGNALKRGNRGNPNKSLGIEKYVGKYGVVVRVQDTGDGFDYREIDRKCNAGERYFERGGKGWRAYLKPNVLVAFAQEGKEINLYYPFARIENEFYSESGEGFSFFRCEERKIGLTYWFNTKDLYVKSTRLRPAGEIVEEKMTPHITDIAFSLQRNERLQTEPLWVYHDKLGRNIIYEGRHRVLGHLLAGREYIAGVLISGNHPKVKSKSQPYKKEYYRKRIIPVTRFLEHVLDSWG